MEKTTLEDAIRLLYNAHWEQRSERTRVRTDSTCAIDGGGSTDDDDDHNAGGRGGEGDNVAYWKRLMSNLKSSFRLLSARASTVLTAPCQYRSGGKASMDCESVAYRWRVVRFLRTVAQCTELALDVCMIMLANPSLFQNDSVSAESMHRKTDKDDSGAIEEIQQKFLKDLRQWLWPICAALEPRMFWDRDPFWRGLMPNHIYDVAWKIYVRLYLLLCFDTLQMLQQRPDDADDVDVPMRGDDDDDEGGESAAAAVAKMPDFHSHHHRRSITRPLHLGVLEDDYDGRDPSIMEFVDPDMCERDTERWPMSILFLAIDSISESWERMQYSPRNVRFVARVLLRYAMLGFARTPSSVANDAREKGYRYAHDEEQFCKSSSSSSSAAAAAAPGGSHVVENTGDTPGYHHHHHHHIEVDPNAYYGLGAAVLRDILGDLCTVVHTDAWISQTTYDAASSGPNCARRVRGELRKAPLMKRLFDALGTFLTGEHSNDYLMGGCKTRPMIEVKIAGLASAASMRAKSERCFASFQEFLESNEGSTAESCLMKSGVSAIIQPGEVHKFVRRWPDHGATPINVVNGLRPRDMKHYGNYVMETQGVGQVFSSAHRRGLPRCLVPLIDHMGWETARQMMRILAINDSTESFVSFLIDPNHVRDSATSTFAHSSTTTSDNNTITSWDRFRMWSPTSELLSDPLEGIVEKMNTVVEYPPFPAIVLMRGRVFIWNPYAPLMDIDVESTDRFRKYDAVDGHGDGYWGGNGNGVGENAAIHEDAEMIHMYLESPLLDMSEVAMPMTLYLWTLGRMCLMKTLLNGRHQSAADARYCFDSEDVRSGSYNLSPALRKMGSARLSLYETLLKRWFYYCLPRKGARVSIHTIT